MNVPQSDTFALTIKLLLPEVTDFSVRRNFRLEIGICKPEVMSERSMWNFEETWKLLSRSLIGLRTRDADILRVPDAHPIDRASKISLLNGSSCILQHRRRSPRRNFVQQTQSSAMYSNIQDGPTAVGAGV